ncbi:MAG TPA: M20/M25/M40 family metallo-hydrolase [Granulicella sp.]|jgi:tripeptide aminopeptidase|nr:M20/M25/M40 family metallo-hydrolase [Granulicella sp.]
MPETPQMFQTRDTALAEAHQRIGRLAALTPIHRAFHWLHLHQPQLRQWQLEMLAIPAPPFGEAARAAWFLERFHALGLTNVHLDPAGNALAELGPTQSSAGVGTDTGTATGTGPCVLLSAHLDTVFPSATVCSPIEDGPRIICPGACDNAAGLTGLLAIAAALRFAGITPPVPILFAANVGEEGEGDLRGMRQLFHNSTYRDRIAAAIALEGSGSSAVVTRALGSRRFRIVVTGPGGHSWTDAGTPNPIFVLGRALAALSQLELPSTPRTTLNAGQIAGGTSINSIPEIATALLDLRSTDPDQLKATELEMRRILQANAPAHTTAKLFVELIGDRPAGALPDDAPLLHTLRAVDRHLHLRTEPRIGSTDANLPLSLNIPAIAIGAGGTGGGIHTLQEWYDPTGRETALRRILLTLLDTLQQTEAPALLPHNS